MLNTKAPRLIPYGPSTLMTRMIEPLIERADDPRTNQSAVASYYGEGFKDNLLSFGRQMTRDLANILGLFVADALSRAGYAYNIAVTYDQNASSVSQLSLINQAGSFAEESNITLPVSEYNQHVAHDWTRFELNAWRWGYGYTTRSATSQVGLVVLCSFMAVVVSYLVWWTYVSVRHRKTHPRRKVTTFRWSSIGEFLALAINSPRSHELEGTCSGIEDSKVWEAPIRIREVEPTHLGLRVGNLEGADVRVTATGRYGGNQPHQRS